MTWIALVYLLGMVATHRELWSVVQDACDPDEVAGATLIVALWPLFWIRVLLDVGSVLLPPGTSR